jgi:hypothetical protein
MVGGPGVALLSTRPSTNSLRVGYNPDLLEAFRGRER